MIQTRFDPQEDWRGRSESELEASAGAAPSPGTANGAASRWSLAGRATRLFLISTTLLALVLATTSTYYLRQSVNDELDALTVSLVKEMRHRLDQELYETVSNPDGTRTALQAPRLDEVDFERVVRRFAETHPEPMGWRVWTMRVPGEWGNGYGDTSLLTDAYPKAEPHNVTHRIEGGLRWRTEPLRADLAVGLVLDGRSHMDKLRRYQWFAFAIIGAYGLIGAALGLFLIQRVSLQLRRVADSARRIRSPGSPVKIDNQDAPDEIRDVADALRELLTNIYNESERNRVLLASMAHELRSPIQNLVGETEVALLQPRDNERYRKLLESHLEEMRDLGDAIDNLVTICARTDPAKQRSQPEGFDVFDEAEIRLQRERSHAHRHGVELELERRGDTRMQGDREGVLRAVRNLAANAVEWSPKGGKVLVCMVGKTDEIEITVDDAGPGVPVAARAKVFDPFVRGPTASGRRIGYGLGLAIVKSAADVQGGSVTIEDSALGGARFRLCLPREPAHALEGAAEASNGDAE